MPKTTEKKYDALHMIPADKGPELVEKLRALMEKQLDMKVATSYLLKTALREAIAARSRG